MGDRITKTKGGGVRPIGRLDLDRSEDELNVNHLGIGKLVSYKHAYSLHYPGGEALALVDGKRGTINHHDDFWQGFARNDIEVVIDLDSLASIKKLGISFHVGSQCMHKISYSKGIREIGNIIKKTKIIPDYINVGGGFPTIYPDLIPQSMEKKNLENRQKIMFKNEIFKIFRSLL